MHPRLEELIVYWRRYAHEPVIFSALYTPQHIYGGARGKTTGSACAGRGGRGNWSEPDKVVLEWWHLSFLKTQHNIASFYFIVVFLQKVVKYIPVKSSSCTEGHELKRESSFLLVHPLLLSTPPALANSLPRHFPLLPCIQSHVPLNWGTCSSNPSGCMESWSVQNAIHPMLFPPHTYLW